MNASLQKNQAAQDIARTTLSELHHLIKPGMTEAEITRMAVEIMTKKGSNTWWYYGLGAFVLSGERSRLSMSGSVYVVDENRRINENDVITIDLAPGLDGHWGDYARTLFMEDGQIRMEGCPRNPEFKQGLETELFLHNAVLSNARPEMRYEDLYELMNAEIARAGFINLDFHGNLGHSVEIDKDDRIYIEQGSTKSFAEHGKPFTFEPHIALPDGAYGYKMENIYYFDDSGMLRLL